MFSKGRRLQCSEKILRDHDIALAAHVVEDGRGRCRNIAPPLTDKPRPFGKMPRNFVTD